jgi:hypothetical protein
VINRLARLRLLSSPVDFRFSTWIDIVSAGKSSPRTASFVIQIVAGGFCPSRASSHLIDF